MRIKMHKKSAKYAQKKSLGIFPKKWSRNIQKIYKNTKNHEYHESTLFTFVCGYSESYASCSSFKIRVRFSVETSHHFRHIDRRTSSNEPTFFVHLFRIQLKSMSNMWNTILNAFVYCNQCIFCHECNWRHSIHWSTQIRHKIQREPNIYFGSRWTCQKTYRIHYSVMCLT